ncbi:hypothetical protein [Rhodococcus erythropolis]|uniref:hypothetical protein n=1 Tax=Rhodococcus erythropolis TaxID=1833 RepID=UPI003013B3B2
MSPKARKEADKFISNAKLSTKKSWGDLMTIASMLFFTENCGLIDMALSMKKIPKKSNPSILGYQSRIIALAYTLEKHSRCLNGGTDKALRAISSDDNGLLLQASINRLNGILLKGTLESVSPAKHFNPLRDIALEVSELAYIYSIGDLTSSDKD